MWAACGAEDFLPLCFCQKCGVSLVDGVVSMGGGSQWGRKTGAERWCGSPKNKQPDMAQPVDLICTGGP